MGITCTRCDGGGFLNMHQLEDYGMDVPDSTDIDSILKWIEKHDNHDIRVCDCCGNGEVFYGVPGEHYNEDLPGEYGPYAYNGGLCECH